MLFNIESFSHTLLIYFEPFYTNMYHVSPSDGAVLHYTLGLEIYGATYVQIYEYSILLIFREKIVDIFGAQNHFEFL